MGVYKRLQAATEGLEPSFLYCVTSFFQVRERLGLRGEELLGVLLSHAKDRESEEMIQGMFPSVTQLPESPDSYEEIECGLLAPYPQDKEGWFSWLEQRLRLSIEPISLAFVKKACPSLRPKQARELARDFKRHVALSVRLRETFSTAELLEREAFRCSELSKALDDQPCFEDKLKAIDLLHRSIRLRSHLLT